MNNLYLYEPLTIDLRIYHYEMLLRYLNYASKSNNTNTLKMCQLYNNVPEIRQQ